MFEMTKKVTAALACVSMTLGVFADEEHSDIEIGQIANKLGVVAAPDEPIFLEVATGLLTGWSAAEPGLFEIEATEEGFDPLNTLDNSGIRLELVSADAGFFFLEQGTFTPLDTPGDFAALGLESSAVHSHPIWVIDDTIVGTGFEGTLSATFKLTDSNGGYADSDNFTLQFTNVPEPTSALLLAGVGLLAARRRRR